MSGEPAIGAVVRCGDLVPALYSTVASLLDSARPPRAVAIVADALTPPAADAWIAAFARARGLRFCRVTASAPGAAWNAGIGALDEPDFIVCVESGDLLARQALQTMARRLADDTRLAFVTSGIEWVRSAGGRAFTSPAGASPAHVLADTRGVHVSSLFRRSLWRSLSGFDERLPALEHTDLWLRMLGTGATAAVERAPLLKRRVHRRALHRRSWTSAEYARAAEIVAERHVHLCAAGPGELLEMLERAGLAEPRRMRELQDRARHVENEIRELAARREAALAAVPADRRQDVDLGGLGRTSPLSHDWGYERGVPADRPLIEAFLAGHASDIRGAVLEIQEDDYTRRFGGARVQRADVLDVDAANPRATVVADLRAADHLESAIYDCIILTQTLHVIDDMSRVVRECERLLKPGGVLLATLPCASRVCLEYGPEGDFWRVTEAGARRLFEAAFAASAIETKALGNPLTNAAFMFGLASRDLPPDAYESHDPYFPMLVGVRAQKASLAHGPSVHRGSTDRRGVVLMYHRVGARGVDPHGLSVPETVFREQIAWLSRTCSVLPLEALAAGDSSARHRRVALTFDDGYLDCLTRVAPVLSDAGLPATFFLTTSPAPSPYHYWWDRLAAAILGPGPRPESLTIDLPAGTTRLKTSGDAERRAAHDVVYDAIVRLPAAPRGAIVERIAAWASLPPLDDDDRRMTWAEVRELARRDGCRVGAHTVNHLFLPAQPDDVLARELTESRVELERQIGAPVETFAYPFGAFDARTMAAVRDAGYTVAVACGERGVTGADDVMALPRIEARDEPLDRFVARVEQVFEAVLA